MSNQIKIPEIINEQKNFCLKIDENNTKIYSHIDYLRQLITNMHSVYQRLCKKIMQVSEDYERKLMKYKTEDNHALIFLNFIKNINLMHLSITNQLNNNSVSLGTKTHKIAKNRLEILREKLIKCNELNQQYLEKVNKYNDKQRSFRNKCEYFNDYQKDVMKYYSLKANSELYQKLTAKQHSLKFILEQIIRNKDQYKINASEIRITISQYYEMETNIISQYKKLLLNIRKSNNNNQIYNQPIIQEQSEDAMSSVLELPLTKRSDKVIKEKTVVLMRKQIIKEFETELQIEDLFQEYIKIFLGQINVTGERIDEIRTTKQYQQFVNQKLVMSEILSAESIKDIDLIINQIYTFRTIVLNLSTVFGKIKVLAELKKYRGFNFDKYVEDTNVFAEHEKKNGQSIDNKIAYQDIEAKFIESHQQYNNRYEQRIIELQTEIVKLYFKNEENYEQARNKRVTKNNLFEKKYYQILMNPFFLNKQEQFVFVQNSHLQKFSKHLNANKIQKMMTMAGFYRKPNQRKKVKITCCGLVKNSPYDSDQQNAPQSLDDYNCALKDGLILIQGKLNLYENFVKFTSNFNSKTLFGYSDIRIPKWDIANFVKDRHLISLMIVIETIHGNMSFTSFISDPMKKLQQIYNNRKSGMSTMEKWKNGKDQLQILEERFQSQLHNELKKKNIIIDKLSTYLSENNNNLSISIEYHMNGTEQTLLFEIKIFQLDITLEYMFIHDESCKNNEIKNLLQKVSQDLINRKVDVKTLLNKSQFENGDDLHLQYSIIEHLQKNKISFMKEPSFIRKQSENDNHYGKDQNLRNSQNQFGNLLSSRNFLSNRQQSRNGELQQNILSSVDSLNETEDKDNTPVRYSNFLQTYKSSQLKNSAKMPVILTPKVTNTPSSRRRSDNSRQSSKTQKSQKSAFKYNTILIFIGVLFCLNLFLNIFN